MKIEIVIGLLIGFSISSCNHSDKKKLNITRYDSCLIKLVKFADTLDLDKVSFIQKSFATNNTFYDQCDFKLYRRNYKFKISIVQIGLKLNLHFLKAGKHDVDLSFLFYSSKGARAIIREIAFFANKKETNYPEFMGTTLVNWIIADDPIS